MGLFYTGFSIALILDRITKQIVMLTIPANSSIEISKFFHITNIKNAGICFGLFDSPAYLPVFIVASIFAVGFIFIYIFKKKSRLSRFSFFCSGLISGGITGNLIDRITYHGVIDFIDFRIWPVFNLADTFIVCGVFCLIFSYWRKDASSML